jgi:hypothetical protein
MFAISLEVMLVLAGILIGITFGTVSGISSEEKMKYTAITVFGTIIVAFTGISYFAYGYSLEVLLILAIFSCIGFTPSYLAGLGYRGWKYKPYFSVIHSPTDWEIEEASRNPPKIDAELKVLGNRIFGLKIQISLVINNITKIFLDDIGLQLKISDLTLKKEETVIYKDLPNIVQNEKRPFVITQGISRKGKVAIDLTIKRKSVNLGEFHWTIS